MALITVGIDKDYTTIMGAYNASSNNDTLWIDEGTYEENLLFENKFVNLVGRINYPAEEMVYVLSDNPNASTLKIIFDIYFPPTTMIIEGIKFGCKHNSNQYHIFYED